MFKFAKFANIAHDSMISHFTWTSYNILMPESSKSSNHQIWSFDDFDVGSDMVGSKMKKSVKSGRLPCALRASPKLFAQLEVIILKAKPGAMRSVWPCVAVSLDTQIYDYN